MNLPGLLPINPVCSMRPFKHLSALVFFIGVFIAIPSAAQTSIDKSKVLDYFQNQQFEEAIGYLQSTMGADSASLPVLSFLGYAYYMNDNNRAAEQCYLKMYSLDSNNITACHYLAAIYNQHQIEASQRFTSRLISLLPAKAMYYRNMGELWKRKNQNDSALLYYEQAYQRAPTDARIISGLSEIYMDLKNYGRADSLLEMGLAKDSLYVPYLKASIRSAYENKDYARVLLPGERLLRLHEVPLQAINRLTASYYNLKRYEDCIRTCEAMIEEGLDLEGLYYYEAKSWSELKDYDKSNDFYAICLSKAISKTGEMYYYGLGQNYEAIKDFKKAVTAYDTAYYLFKSPLMLYNAGRIYEVELKNDALARKYYARYLAQAKPEAVDEKKAYAYVKERWSKKKTHTKPTAKPVATPAAKSTGRPVRPL
jgi:tetratricopeptide (TPR) repeat protein